MTRLFDEVWAAKVKRLTKERDDALKFRAANMAEHERRGASQMRERAAQVAHGNGIYSHNFIGEEIPEDVVTNNNLCWIIRNAIRALPLEESK